MEKGANFSSEQINSVLEDTKGESVESLMNKRLTPQQQQAVKNILADPERLQKIMSSPLAKKLVESINKSSRGKEK